MLISRLSTDVDYNELLISVGADKRGVDIMSKKAQNFIFKIENLSIKAANVLKQEALSLGAELGVGENVSRMIGETTDAVLIIDKNRLEKLTQKLKFQPFGLKKLGEYLLFYTTKESNFPLRLMGVLNINKDSFYAKSRVNEDNFLHQAQKLLNDGADILDIGAVSSRPGSVYPGVNEEFKRIAPILDILSEANLAHLISLDSFEPKVISYALKKGVKIINDITGLENEEIGKLCAEYDATLIIMHKIGNTLTMQKNPNYNNLIDEIDNFFDERINKAIKLGVKEIILDPGIGFGKNLEHNLTIIKRLKHFTKFGREILIGASRKSLIDKISPSAVEDRLGGTLTLHLKALDEGANIIRAHDVFEHAQAIKVWKAFKKTI